MTTHLFVRPGIWYKIHSLEDLLEHWIKGSDFQIIGPECYCSILDTQALKAQGYTSIFCRWKGENVMLASI